MLLNILKNISQYIQTKTASLQRHEVTYADPNLLKEEKRKWREGVHAAEIKNSEFALDKLLARYPSVRDMAVDIGAGVGWLAALLSKDFKQVVAIEPSKQALQIAQELYPATNFSNIVWHNGFAENILAELQLEQPALFVTGVVLSHLRDKEVKTICEEVAKKAPRGSILCFDECWGREWHQIMWHSRTKEWWQGNFPGWNLDFHGPEITETPGIYKGIHGVKIQ
jgi:2-polyprenyl-3-methyl-5-hydroxy-6-metoxy-1,4-benzoquinol methylase